jgi:hypothetical protein
MTTINSQIINSQIINSQIINSQIINSQQINEEDEQWGFYVDIENIFINKQTLPKNKRFYLAIEDISEEFEYYSKQHENYISENILYKNETNEKKQSFINIFYTSIIILLLCYTIFYVI